MVYYNIKSQTKPIEVDDTSSETTVFVRKNIREEVEIDPVFKTENKVFIYDEYQYTFKEWYKIVTDDLFKKVEDTQSALIEILDLFTVTTFDNDDKSEDTPLMKIYNKLKNKE